MGRKGSLQERLVLIAICFGYMIFGSVYSIVARERTFDYTNQAMALLFAEEVVLGIAAILFLRRRGWRLGEFGFSISTRSTLGALLVFFGSNVACGVAYLLLQPTGMLEGWEITTRFVAHPLLVLPFLIANSFFEEFFVVGYLIESMRDDDVAMAISVSALVRLLYHIYQGPVALAGILPIGLIFAIVYVRYRNLWPLIVAHTLFNVAGWMAQ